MRGDTRSKRHKLHPNAPLRCHAGAPADTLSPPCRPGDLEIKLQPIRRSSVLTIKRPSICRPIARVIKLQLVSRLGALVILLPLLLGGSCDRPGSPGSTAGESPTELSTRPAERSAKPTEPPLHFSGRVVAVGDGDTVEVLPAGPRDDAREPGPRPVRVRLVEIDCPELGQPFGRKAKQAASELCFGQTVRVDGTGVDTFGRVLGIVTLADGRVLNEELVRLGYAWWFRKYSRSDTLQRLEAEARDARAGLWADPHPVPPWQWRERSRRGN